MLDNLALVGNLTEPDFTIEGVEFHIAPLNPFDGYQIFEEIRNEIGKVTGAQSQPLNVNIMGAGLPGDFIQILLNMPRAYVEALRVRMFEEVFYAYPGAREREKLVGNERSAFSALQPIAVYEVLVRCLAVNFTSSCISLFSTGKMLFNQAMAELGQISPEAPWQTPAMQEVASQVSAEQLSSQSGP